MTKDPAFLFYSDNFMSGIMFFSDQQIGQYIRLLCAQHLTGHLHEKDMLKICKTKDEDIWSKFKIDNEGKYYNQRLEYEIFKRKNFSESRSKNRMGKVKTELKPKKKKSIISDQHLENEIGNENENDIEKRKQEFAKKVSLFGDGISKEILLSFFDYWTEHNEGGKKLRFEMQPVFDITKRLATWTKNNKTFNNGKSKYNSQSELDAAVEALFAGSKM